MERARVRIAWLDPMLMHLADIHDNLLFRSKDSWSKVCSSSKMFYECCACISRLLEPTHISYALDVLNKVHFVST
jgi:hypothetical protein